MREETNLARAIRPSFARPRPIPAGVQPELKHTVRELAVLALAAVSCVSELRTSHSDVRVFPWVTPTSFLTSVCVWTFCPVVTPVLAASLYLECVHPELICVLRFLTSTADIVCFIGVRHHRDDDEHAMT